MKSQELFELVFVFALLAASGEVGHAQSQTVAKEAISVARQDCSGYGGPKNCYTSQAAREADYGGIGFKGSPSGDLVGADKIAVARIEGTWAQPDTQPFSLSGWTTDAGHYVRVYTTVEARHDGTPGSGYQLVTTGDRPIYSNMVHFRVDGLQVTVSPAPPSFSDPVRSIKG